MADDRAPWESPAAGRYDPAAENLDELRELLLGAERRRLRELERRLDAAGLTREELAELLPEAIALRAGRDRQLARALAPTVESAIGESVRRNPREIASAIFPVLGPAIRKAIAEALAGLVASINSTIEHSLSPRGLKWRLEAWRTGVPYAQIVLKHALVYRVEQVFLIHADTGLLLAHAWAPELPASDADLISGMLTAIRDFVADSFARERDAGGLRQFSVGELTIMVGAPRHWRSPPASRCRAAFSHKSRIAVSIPEIRIPAVARWQLRGRAWASGSPVSAWMRKTCSTRYTSACLRTICA